MWWKEWLWRCNKILMKIGQYVNSY
jgi:hypothetical protein